MSESVVINDTTYNNVDTLALLRPDGTVVTFYPDAVRYGEQNLSEAQKVQARKNIGAGSIDEVAEEVLARLGTPVFGTVDSDNNIILTGNLVNGTYTLKYEDASGNQTEIGTIKIGSSYTNLAGTITENVRLSSSGSTKDSTGAVVTDYIPCVNGDTLRIKGLDILTNPLPDGANSAAIGMYKGDKTANGILYPKNDTSKYTTTNGITTFTLDTGSATDIAYVRICGTPIAGEEIVVTVNQEITEEDNSGPVALTITYGVKLDKNTGAEGSAAGYAASQNISYDSAYTYTMSTSNDFHAYGAACWYDASGKFLGWNEVITTGTSPGADNSGILTPLDGASTFRLRIVVLNEGDEDRISLRKDLI